MVRHRGRLKPRQVNQLLLVAIAAVVAARQVCDGSPLSEWVARWLGTELAAVGGGLALRQRTGSKDGQRGAVLQWTDSEMKRETVRKHNTTMHRASTWLGRKADKQREMQDHTDPFIIRSGDNK